MVKKMSPQWIGWVDELNGCVRDKDNGEYVEWGRSMFGLRTFDNLLDRIDNLERMITGRLPPVGGLFTIHDKVYLRTGEDEFLCDSVILEGLEELCETIFN
jgi:hypothetical protein